MQLRQVNNTSVKVSIIDIIVFVYRNTDYRVKTNTKCLLDIKEVSPVELLTLVIKTII